MILACGVGLRAIEAGRLRTLLGCAVLVGLAFNTKTLAAYLVVPGLGARLPGVRAGIVRTPLRSPARGGRGAARRIRLVVGRCGTDARLTAAVRGRLDRQHRAQPDVRLQRVWARRRTGRRPGAHSGHLQARLARAHRKGSAARPRRTRPAHGPPPPALAPPGAGAHPASPPGPALGSLPRPPHKAALSPYLPNGRALPDRVRRAHRAVAHCSTKVSAGRPDGCCRSRSSA